MIKINLLQVRAAKKKETLQHQTIVAAMSFVFVIVMIGYVHVNIVKRIADVNEKTVSTQAELEKTKAEIGEVKKFKEAKKILEDKLGVIETLKRAKSGPVKMLDELSRVTPAKLWVVSFKEKGTDISIEGVALGNEIIAQFMIELEKSPQFKDIELIVTEQVDQKGMKLKKYSLTGKLEVVEPKKEEPPKKSKK